MRNNITFQWRYSADVGNHLLYHNKKIMVSVLYVDFKDLQGFSASVAKTDDISVYKTSEVTQDFGKLMLWIDDTIDEVSNL